MFLGKIPDETFDCCVTSPPYYGLRTYGEAEAVWGGDKNCQHQWVVKEDKLHSGRGDCQKSGKYSEQEAVPDVPYKVSFCSICSAWRGELGLESTPELYLTHLWAVFDEVWRVMKKTGTLWVNIGDTYGGSGSPGGDFRDGKGGDEYLRSYGRSKIQPKCLLTIPERFLLGLLERDLDDDYELRKDLSPDELKYVSKELEKVR